MRAGLGARLQCTGVEVTSTNHTPISSSSWWSAQETRDQQFGTQPEAWEGLKQCHSICPSPRQNLVISGVSCISCYQANNGLVLSILTKQAFQPSLKREAERIHHRGLLLAKGNSAEVGTAIGNSQFYSQPGHIQ